MSRWPVVVLSALSLTTCTPVQEAYHTGARDVLTALEAEVQQKQTVAGDTCPNEPYRLPVVTQMRVPTAIVGGVLIPAHQTYVVLQPGAWISAERDAPTPGCHPLRENR
jgi:hypothetical protein